MSKSIEFAPSSKPDPKTPEQIAREFKALLADGVALRPAGRARSDPERKLRRYVPRAAVDLFDTRYYLSDVRQNEDIRFFVGYVRLGDEPALYPRIFYKDVSLIWRSASHFVDFGEEGYWIGKGDIREFEENGRIKAYSAEETTDLPLEIQTAFEVVLRRAKSIRTDYDAVPLILRQGPRDRTEAFADFTRPRKQARQDPRNLVNGGRPIARFTRENDPASLVFVKGFEPDFEKGICERSASKSRLYGGRVRRFRILSKNRRIQYLFMAGPKLAWIIPPQTTASLITSYGVRAIDVIADDELTIPAYEYHYLDESFDRPRWYSQIPEGYVGGPSDVDHDRWDASPWIERLPVIQQFRRKVLGRKGG